MQKAAVFLSVILMCSAGYATINSPMEIFNTSSDTFAIMMPSGMSSEVDGSGGYWALIGTEAHPVTGGVYSPPDPIEVPEPPIILDAGETGIFPYGVGVWGIFYTSAEAPWSAPAGMYAGDFFCSGGTVEDPIRLYTFNEAFVFVLKDTYVPEPTSLLLLGMGTAVLRRRR